MTEIHLNLKNLSDLRLLLSLFPTSNIYEFTTKKVYRLKDHKLCSHGHEMVHNGYDYARKKGFGKVKVGKQICPICREEHREDKGFWKGLLSRWQGIVTDLIMTLRDSHVAWEKISGVMNYILPIGKDKASTEEPPTGRREGGTGGYKNYGKGCTDCRIR